MQAYNYKVFQTFFFGKLNHYLTFATSSYSFIPSRVRSPIISNMVEKTDLNTTKLLFFVLFCFDRMSMSRRAAHKKSTESTSASCKHMYAMTSDVIAPSPWKIFGCQNGEC